MSDAPLRPRDNKPCKRCQYCKNLPEFCICNMNITPTVQALIDAAKTFKQVSSDLDLAVDGQDDEEFELQTIRMGHAQDALEAAARELKDE